MPRIAPERRDPDSLDLRQPRGGSFPAADRAAPRTPRAPQFAAAATAALAALTSVVGCSSSSPAAGGATASESAATSTADAPSPSAPSEVPAVQVAYRAFWPVLTSFNRQPESQWRSVLGRVAADPQLSFAIAVTRQQRRDGITQYGVAGPRAPKVTLTGPGRAGVKDCVDFSRTGQADARTHTPRTVGVARTPLSLTLIKGADQRWRVSQVIFPGGHC